MLYYTFSNYVMFILAYRCRISGGKCIVGSETEMSREDCMGVISSNPGYLLSHSFYLTLVSKAFPKPNFLPLSPASSLSDITNDLNCIPSMEVINNKYKTLLSSNFRYRAPSSWSNSSPQLPALPPIPPILTSPAIPPTCPNFSLPPPHLSQISHPLLTPLPQVNSFSPILKKSVPQSKSHKRQVSFSVPFSPIKPVDPFSSLSHHLSYSSLSLDEISLE